MPDWGQRQTAPQMRFLCKRQASGKPLDFTGLDVTKFTLIIRPPSGTDIIGGGSFTVHNAAMGVLDYQPVANDFATLGQNTVLVEAQFPTGPDTSIPFVITVVQR